METLVNLLLNIYTTAQVEQYKGSVCYSGSQQRKYHEPDRSEHSNMSQVNMLPVMNFHIRKCQLKYLE